MNLFTKQKHIHKTEADSQIQKTNLVSKEEGSMEE